MGMFENIEALDKEISRITEEISKLDPKGEVYKAVRLSLDSLYKVRNDVYKCDTEDIAGRDKAEADAKQKKEELEFRKEELELTHAKIAEELATKRKEIDAANERFNREMAQREAELEMRKLEMESVERQHKEDMKSQRNSRIKDYVVTTITVVVKIATAAVAAGLTYEVAKKGYEFETNGCPTSRTFKDELKNAVDLFKDLAKK